MASVKYNLGDVLTIQQLYPPAEYINADVGLLTWTDVIRHFTLNSLAADAVANAEVVVEHRGPDYVITINGDVEQEFLDSFAQRHQLLFSKNAGAKAIAGKNLMKEMNVWNPMAGFHVNDDPADGKCKWHLFPPLGLNIAGQKGILLLHYPPWQVLQQGTFLEVMTMHRWSTVLKAAGVPKDEISFFRTFVDVNPIAAPGSGQSEYPNDYFPIMMASAFFDGPPERDYIRSMLELYLNPPGESRGDYTLPLLICGSDLYDPQAPGWFRVTYKEHLPQNKKTGEVLVDVLQVGEFKVRPDSERATPYMIGNHMIAAGVAGKCTDNPGAIPDIRKYEAQDLVAATFLYSCAMNPDLSPEDAKKQACRRWFGADDGNGAPNPPDPKDQQALCALAQMDLFFCPTPSPHPKYSWKKALKRCEKAKNGDNPCAAPIGPES